jgi:hypothetical protein
MKYHYVYYSYEEWGRGYIGTRTCGCLPEKDFKYFGSFKDKTFKPTQKIILQVFKTREESLKAEVILHNFYEVNINLHFANRAKQTSFKFTFIPSTRDERDKISKNTRGRKWWKRGKEVSFSRECPGPDWMPGRALEYTEKYRKGLSTSVGKRWFTNGKLNVFVYSAPTGENWRPGRTVGNSQEEKERRANALKNHRWWTNEADEIFCKNCPDGWVSGRSKKVGEKISRTKKSQV